MSDLDQLCTVCGARLGAHGAPNPRCPDGAAFSAISHYEPGPGRRERHYAQREDLLAAARMGVQPLWRPERAPNGSGRDAVAGWTLNNRAEIEWAAREWRRHLRAHPPGPVDIGAIGNWGQRT